MAVADYSLAEDVEIVSAIAAGEQAALATLYDRYHRPCFAFAVRMLASEEDAREAVQEAFVRIWRSAAAYERERASVAGWVLSITRNLCIDELRRRLPWGGPERSPPVGFRLADRIDHRPPYLSPGRLPHG